MRGKAKQKVVLPRHRINDEIIGLREVRITGEGLESKIVSLSEAKSIASEMELDLIEVAPAATPPVMRIGSYEKMVYDMKKNLKKQKQKTSQMKEVQLRVNIAQNDMLTKSRKAREFIEDGDRVKVVLGMRGRELSRREENKRTIYEFITMLDDVAVPESMPRDEGNRTIVILKAKRTNKNNNNNTRHDNRPQNNNKGPVQVRNQERTSE